MEVKPRLIIGLGNPDKEYERTYHNVGFLTVDFLAKNLPASKLVKSEVFMNESGSFVRKTAKQKNAKPEDLLIIHDDSDIKMGEYKLSFGRSSAGHRGVQSVIDSLKTKNFWRLRIGIRKNKKQKAMEIVLKKISKADMETLNKVFKEFLACLK
ncbi:MAG: aminoacyl-tRNA hydrolase [Candidatus Paceibacterota bacterium]